MQAVHRQFGKFMKRLPDDSQVSVLLKDFDDADQLLGRVRLISPQPLLRILKRLIYYATNFPDH